ncbi:MAG: lipid-A-disaccharide synthase [Rhizobiaceae bacterium]|nr:lipid-A-disaccharide synthase [Rhizobiaceae bacterium]
MNPTAQPLRIAVVAGEESGDLLGADLVAALKAAGREVNATGVGGHHLAAHGLETLFDPAEIALIGIGAILRDLPRLVRRIGQTARAIVAARPDCLVTIDSPDFSLRVARKVRALDPSIPIIHYVCPSVWAWRPGRAVAMRPHVDHVLCLLPFEPAELLRLGGPPGTFVGHRLSRDRHVLAAAAAQAARQRDGARRTLLLLPGSRRAEVSALLEPFGETLSVLQSRGRDLRVVLPTLPRLEDTVRAAVAGWSFNAEIRVGEEAKWQAFGEADAALVASGTVTLELALTGVPLVSCYRVDAVSAVVGRFMLKGWAGALPNLIADRAVVPEFYQDYVRPGMLARWLEGLIDDTALRQWQLEGFAEARRRLAVDEAAGTRAARIVTEAVGSRDRGQRLAIGT